MLIYGGLTKRGTDDSLWSFNVTTLRWNKVTGTFKFCKNLAVVIAFGVFSSASDVFDWMIKVRNFTDESFNELICALT